MSILLTALFVCASNILIYKIVKKDSDERIALYKEAFSKGYETTNHTVPFVQDDNDVESTTFDETLDNEDEPIYLNSWERGYDN